MKILMVIYDNDSYIHWFPQGPAYIASTLLKHGCDEFHMALFEANSSLMQNYFEKKKISSVEQARKLYVEKDSNFRGFRQS